MERPSYLYKYLLNWEIFDILLDKRSVIDSDYFAGENLTSEEAQRFMHNYGLNLSSPVSRAELYGTYQESLQFILRYFLAEGNPEDGFDFKIPSIFYEINDITQLFVIASEFETQEPEVRIWAEIILKIIHTYLHIDRDIRSNYFSEVQTQIFDRFYKYLHRNDQDQLFIGNSQNKFVIPLVDFQTKAKKSRSSILIKLLHKDDNVAEELFDRVGVRFITQNKIDSLRLVKYLVENSIVIPHNAITSRTVNSLFDFEDLKKNYMRLIKEAMRHHWTEDEFVKNVETEIEEHHVERGDLVADRNKHSKPKYRSLQFTCRQLIRYTNPFYSEFHNLRQLAKKMDPKENILAEHIINMDLSLLSKEVKFFYPFELQITDKESHRVNTEGEASHKEYKRAQLRSARDRIFKPLLDYYDSKTIDSPV